MTIEEMVRGARWLEVQRLRLLVQMQGGDWEALVDTTREHPVSIETCWAVISAYLHGRAPVYPGWSPGIGLGPWDELEAVRMRERIIYGYHRHAGLEEPWTPTRSSG